VQASAGTTSFDGTTLTLSAVLCEQIIGFDGDGTLAGSDKIDLREVGFHSVHSSFDGSNGRLTVSDSHDRQSSIPRDLFRGLQVRR
jgi:hypothetical protein